MNALAMKENIKTQIDALPETALPSVLDFVLFQKNRAAVEDGHTKAERDKALEYLLNLPKRLPPDFNYKKELMESIDERYNSPDRHYHSSPIPAIQPADFLSIL
jgi:hypothetical protein